MAWAALFELARRAENGLAENPRCCLSSRKSKATLLACWKRSSGEFGMEFYRDRSYLIQFGFLLDKATGRMAKCFRKEFTHRGTPALVKSPNGRGLPSS